MLLRHLQIESAFKINAKTTDLSVAFCTCSYTKFNTYV